MHCENKPELRLDHMRETELPAYRALYLEAFPESERKPFFLLQTRAARRRKKHGATRPGGRDGADGGAFHGPADVTRVESA